MTPTENGWNTYQELVLYRLNEQQEAIKALTTAVNALKTSMALTRLKLAFIGFASGTVGSAIVYALSSRAFK
jgi:hypothetical protein